MMRCLDSIHSEIEMLNTNLVKIIKELGEIMEKLEKIHHKV